MLSSNKCFRNHPFISEFKTCFPHVHRLIFNLLWLLSAILLPSLSVLWVPCAVPHVCSFSQCSASCVLSKLPYLTAVPDGLQIDRATQVLAAPVGCACFESWPFTPTFWSLSWPAPAHPGLELLGLKPGVASPWSISELILGPCLDSSICRHKDETTEEAVP